MANLNQMNAALKSSAPEPVKFKELFTDREKALNFELLANREINALTPAAAPAGAPPAAAPPGLAHLQSLAEKMHLIAHSPDAAALNINITPEENTQFLRLMGEHRLGQERIKNNKEKMSPEDREAIVRLAALDPRYPELAGLLDVEGGEDRIRRAIDSLAFANPTEYTNIMNTFAQSRRFAKGDWGVLKPFFAITDAYEGGDKSLVLQAINNPAANWEKAIVQAATPGLQGKYGITSGARI